MPSTVGIPISKRNQIKRANSNLSQTWIVYNPFDFLTNRKKIFILDNNTISSIFDETQFTQGTTAGTSDLLQLFIPEIGLYRAYFFRSDVQKWRLSSNRSGPDQNNVVIPNKSIIIINKVTGGSKTITLKGNAAITPY
jgi:hypothetical protein